MAIAIPVAFQQFLLSAVGAGDSLMLGLVDENAMAAASLAANVEFIENLFLSAFIGGATILTAQYWGKGDKNTIERVFGLILRYSAVICVAFTAVALMFPRQLMSLFTDEAELISIGADYIVMASGSYLLTGITQCYLCIMKTTGQTKQSVFISTVALCLDTLLNALFILCFNMGAGGAALTTSITRAIELLAVLVFSGKMSVKPKIFSKTSRALHVDFLKCSIPHLINSMLWGLGTAVYSAIIGHLGTHITTAYSVAAIARNLAISLSRGFYQGTEIILANVLGANRLEQAKALGKRLSGFSVICGFVCSFFVLIFGFLLSHIMNVSDAAQEYLKYMIFISAFYVLTQCINIIVVCGIFAAGGDTAFDAYSVAVTMWLIIIPLALAAAFWLKLSPLAVYFILSLDEVIKLPWIYAHYKKYKWLNNVTREDTKYDNA